MNLEIQNKNIVVCGDNGFLGAHLSKILTKLDANVICIDKKK